MNKHELIAAVAGRSALKKTQASDAVDALFATISEALSSGNDVRIVGFGTFSVTYRAASEGRNPRTGEPMHIPASKTPKFKAGKGLKEMVNS